MTHLIRSLILLLGLLLLLTGITFGWLLGTDAGLKFVLAHVAGLNVASAKGRLWDQLQLQGISYQQDNLHIDIDSAQLTWHPGALFSRTLHIAHLSTEKITLHLPAPTSPTHSGVLSLPDIALPFDLRIDALNVKDMAVFQGNTVHSLTHFSAQMHTQRSAQRLHLSHVHIRLADMQAELYGTLGLYAPHAVALHFKGQHPLSATEQVNGTIHLYGTVDELRLELDAALVPATHHARMTGAFVITDPLNTRQWQADLHLHPLDSTKLTFLNALPFKAEMRVHAQGDSHHAIFTSDIDFHSHDYGAAQFTLNGSGDRHAVRFESVHGTLLEGTFAATAAWHWENERQAQLQVRAREIKPSPYMLHYIPHWPLHWGVNLEIDAHVAGTHFEMKQLHLSIPASASHLSATASGHVDGRDIQAQVQWRDLQWPLQQHPPQVASTSGTLNVSATPTAYALTLDSQLEGEHLPPGQWSIIAQATPQGIEFERIHATLLDGTLDGSGSLTWASNIAWDLNLVGKSLQAQQHWPQAPEQLSFHADSQGRWHQGHIQGQFDLSRASARWHDYPLTASAQISADERGYHLPFVRFNSHSAQGEIKGRFGETLDLQWDINIRNLAHFVTTAQGGLHSQGQVYGTPTQPKLKAQLQGTALAWQDTHLDALDAKAELNLFDPNAPLQIQLTATQLRQGTHTLERLSLDAQGKSTRHHIQLALTAPAYDSKIMLNGGFDRAQQSWHGVLSKAEIASTDLGQWHLTQEAALQLNPRSMNLEQSCWQQQQARFCTRAMWQANAAANVDLSVHDFDLAQLTPLLNDAFSLQGTLNAELAAQHTMTDCTTPPCMQLHAQLDITPGRLQTELGDGTPLDVDHHGATVSASWKHNLGQAQWEMRLTQNDFIRGTVNLNGNPTTPDHHLSGSSTLQIDDLSLLSALLPSIDHAQGRIAGQLNLSGNLQRPQVQGLLHLSHGRAEMRLAGIELDNISARLEGDDSGTLHLEGSVHSGGGKIALSGQIQNPGTGWQGQLHLYGEEFEAMNTPDAWLFVSPDLHLNLAPQKLHISGNVTIPRAELTPQGAADSHNKVRVSDDIVFVGAVTEEQQSAPATDWVISSDVRLLLGERVRVEAAGFKGYVNGHLHSRSDNNRAPVGSGEIRVSGTYKSYGQDLSVEQGLVLFHNSALDNPSLNLRATRRHEGDNVTSGVYVRGSVDTPEVTLFSDPAMDQANALSYLVLGAPLGSSTSKNDGETLMRAAAALPLGKSSFLTRRLGQAFGLDEARISSEGNLELGKQVTPRMYLKYTSSLFDPGHLLKLRYRLTSTLYLETEAGKETGVDLLYTLER
jgi:translocation and assembly module TamB